jgi:hypothetical protein
MTPTVEEARAAVVEVELAMLDGAGTIEALRPLRSRLLEQLREAEEAAAMDCAKRPTKWELWEEWQDVKWLSRRRLSARQKSHIITRFGIENYRKLPR